MKKEFLKTLAMTAVLACIIFACANNEKDFQETLKTHLAAVEGRDLGALMPTIADSITLILPNGSSLYTKDEFEKLHVEWFKETKWKWTPSVIKTTVSPSVCFAYVIYQYDEMDSTGSISPGRKTHLLLIFKKIYGRWLLVHDQNTRIE